MFYSKLIYGDVVLCDNPQCDDSYDQRGMLVFACRTLQRIYPSLAQIYVEQFEDDDVLPKIYPLSSMDDVEGYDWDSAASEEFAVKLIDSAKTLIKREWAAESSKFAKDFGAKIEPQYRDSRLIGFLISDGGELDFFCDHHPSPIEVKKVIIDTYGRAIVMLLTKFMGETQD
jgi:hypothetical protein